LPSTRENKNVLYIPSVIERSKSPVTSSKINQNLHSSRSHAIFTVTIECSEKGPDGKHHVRAGKLHLVDLAVSYINLTRKECDMDENS
jgi:hypothetical protein